MAAHLHAAIRGAIPRRIIKETVAAVYYSAWWPPIDQVLYDAQVPRWDGADYVDPNTGVVLPTWEEALDQVQADPDAEPLHLSRIQLALERAGFEVHHVEDFRDDYAETLRHWAARLDEHLDAARRLAGSDRVRVWRLYLRAARNGFETGQTAVYQMLCSAPLTEPSSPAPTGRRHGEARRRLPA